MSWAVTLFMLQKRSKEEAAEGKQGADTGGVHSLTTCHPSPGFTNRRAVCPSGFQGTLEDQLQPPPSSCSPSVAMGPQDLSLGGYQLCVFLTLLLRI